MKEFFGIYKKIIFEVIIIVLISIFSFSLAPKTLQNDTFYTVTIGNYIINNGIDMKDHFSWHEDLPYTYPHWAFDVINATIYNRGGWKAIYIFVCIISILLGITIYLVNKKLNKNQIISFFVTIGVMFLLKDYIAARAQLVTFWMFIILIYLIEKFIENPKKIYYAFFIIVFSIVIANIHLAVWPFIFVLALPYIAEYIICLLADIIIYRKANILIKKIIKRIHKKNLKKVEQIEIELDKIHLSNEKRKEARLSNEPYKIKMKKNNNVKWLILLILICALTGFFTPLGKTPYTYLINTMKGETTQNINEHLPLTLINNIPIMCTIIIFIATITFTKVKIKLSDLFFLSGLTYLMFLSKRQTTIFALIGSIVLNRLIVQMIEIYSTYKIEEISKKMLNIGTVVIAILLVMPYSFKLINEKKDDVYVSEKTYPVKASKWMKENLDINNIKLFNEYNYGSYLLYEGIPVFIDSRADLYTPEFNKNDDIFMNFINTSNIGKFYGTTFKDYKITHIILYKNSKISMLIDKTDTGNYNKIYSDNNFVIYEVI